MPHKVLQIIKSSLWSAYFSINILFLAACNMQQASYLDYSSKPDQIKTCYEAADMLAEQLVARNTAQPVIVKTIFTDIDYPDKTSSNGRMYSEAIASRMSQRGFSMVEVNPKFNSKSIPSKIDVASLSTDQIELAKSFNASAILIGYYKRIPRKTMTILYVRIVNVKDNVIWASEDISIED